MYAGQVVEQGSITEILTDPRHEYTRGLLGSVTSIEAGAGRLHQVPGTVPSPADFPKGDRFAPRSSHPDRGLDTRPVMKRIGDTYHYYAVLPDGPEPDPPYSPPAERKADQVYAVTVEHERTRNSQVFRRNRRSCTMSGYQTPDPVPGQGEPPAPAASAARATAASGQVPIIELRDVDVVFTTRAGKLHPNKIKAVNKVNIQLLAGQTIGIVGESGCGKSTTANVMCGLQQATSGQVLFKGVDVTHRSAKDRKEIGRVVSVVFQDPATALNARMTVEDQLIDPLVVHKLGDGRKSRAARARELLTMVGLPKSALGALPGQLPAASASVWLLPVHCP